MWEGCGVPDTENTYLVSFIQLWGYGAVGCEFSVHGVKYGISEKEDTWWSVSEITLENAEVTSGVCDKTMEKMEKQLELVNWWDSWLLKNVVSSFDMGLKAKHIVGHVPQGQKNGKPSLSSTGWLTYLKRWYSVKMLNVYKMNKF